MQRRKYSNSRGGNRGGFRGRRRFTKKEKGIDVSRFINKEVYEEKEEVYTPTHTFSDFDVNETLKENVARKGYSDPTPIQDSSIPHIILGKDVVGIANTGTGKTAAFLIPLIDKVINNPEEFVLIMVPTRELALQIEEELYGFTKRTPIFSTCCVGGMPIDKQIRGIQKCNNFVIGTPGRLKDLIERGVLDLSKFNSVVLDEADRMLDMGFIDDMRYMLSLMPRERHTLFFSATLSREIEVLIDDFLNNPVRISVKTQDTSKSVHQDVVRVEEGKTKLEILRDLLGEEEFTRVLIFAETKRGVENLSRDLTRMGLRANSIHGDKTQYQRERALMQFKDGKVQALVATDVAARGLDISGVSHVINFETPRTYESYIHRIGRTGRGGKKGKALTFID